jgi:hypothetical protein
MRKVLIVFLQQDLIVNSLQEKNFPLVFPLGGAKIIAVPNRKSAAPRLKTAPKQRPKKENQKEPNEVLIVVVVVSFIIFVRTFITVPCRMFCSSLFYIGRRTFQHRRSFLRPNTSDPLNILKLIMNKTSQVQRFIKNIKSQLNYM